MAKNIKHLSCSEAKLRDGIIARTKSGHIPIEGVLYSPRDIKNAIRSGNIDGLSSDTRLSDYYHSVVKNPARAPEEKSAVAVPNVKKKELTRMVSSFRRVASIPEEPKKKEIPFLIKDVIAAIIAYYDDPENEENPIPRKSDKEINYPPFDKIRYDDKPITWERLHNIMKSGQIKYIQEGTKLHDFAESTIKDYEYEQAGQLIFASVLVDKLSAYYLQHGKLPKHRRFKDLTGYELEDVEAAFEEGARHLVGWWHYMGLNNKEINKLKKMFHREEKQELTNAELGKPKTLEDFIRIACFRANFELEPEMNEPSEADLRKLEI